MSSLPTYHKLLMFRLIKVKSQYSWLIFLAPHCIVAALQH